MVHNTPLLFNAKPWNKTKLLLSSSFSLSFQRGLRLFFCFELASFASVWWDLVWWNQHLLYSILFYSSFFVRGSAGQWQVCGVVWVRVRGERGQRGKRNWRRGGQQENDRVVERARGKNTFDDGGFGNVVGEKQRHNKNGNDDLSYVWYKNATPPARHQSGEARWSTQEGTACLTYYYRYVYSCNACNTTNSLRTVRAWWFQKSFLHSFLSIFS